MVMPMPWPKGKPRPPAVSAKAAATIKAGTAAARKSIDDAIIKFLAGGGGWTTGQLAESIGCEQWLLEDQVMPRLTREDVVVHAGHPRRYYLKETI